MSVLNKIPYINAILGDLETSDLTTLLNLMNGSGDRTELLRIMNLPSGNRTNITVADKGVHMCSIQLGPTLYYGYLLYSDNYCTLLSFTDFQNISMFAINVSKKSMETVSEYLDINELRSTLGDLLAEGGGSEGGMTNPMTTAGDIIIGGSSGSPTRLAVGSNGKVLTSDGTTVSWETPSTGMSNPMTTADDIIVGGSSGTPTRLAKGSNGQLLGVNGSGNIAFKNDLPYLTTAPSAANTSGGLILVVLSAEPATYYDGYYYIITESVS